MCYYTNWSVVWQVEHEEIQAANGLDSENSDYETAVKQFRRNPTAPAAVVTGPLHQARMRLTPYLSFAQRNLTAPTRGLTHFSGKAS